MGGIFNVGVSFSYGLPNIFSCGLKKMGFNNGENHRMMSQAITIEFFELQFWIALGSVVVGFFLPNLIFPFHQ